MKFQNRDLLSLQRTNEETSAPSHGDKLALRLVLVCLSVQFSVIISVN